MPGSTNSLKRVCVFAASSPGTEAGFARATQELGTELGRRKLELVYGGANVGLMGRLADAALSAGAHVIGVMPRHLVEYEIAHQGLPDLRIVESMHERKALMAELSDAFVALPGGFGTLEETFEVLTWRQLGLHHKPVALLNIAGFFDPLIAFLDRGVELRFISRENRDLLLVEETVDRMFAALQRESAPAGAKWLDRDKT